MRTPGCFADFLNWGALVAPGAIACRDGSCLAGWRMRGLDTESMAADALRGRLAWLAARLSEFGDAHTLWVVFRRRPWRPEPLLAETGDAALDVLAIEANALLAAPGALWSDDLLLFLGWRPDPPQPDLEALLDAFGEECGLLESRLDSGLGLTRLDRTERAGGDTVESELCGHLAALVGDPRRPPRLAAASLPVGLDRLLAPDIVQPSLSGPLRVSGRPCACFAVGGLGEVYPLAATAALQDIRAPLVWVTRFAAMSQRTAHDRALWRRRIWLQSGADMRGNVSGGGGGRPKLFEARMSAGVDRTLGEIASGTEGYGGFTSTVILQGDHGAPHSDLAPAVRALRETFGETALTLREERANALPAFLSALPGHAAPNPRAVMVRARVMADLMPVRGIDGGRPTCPSGLLPPGTPALLPVRARTGGLFHLNLHHGEVGHTLLFGPTGGGKSVLLGLLASAWLRLPEARVILFDRGGSVRHACHALGGRWLEPGRGGPSGIAPLAHMASLGAGWAAGWLAELVRQETGERPSPGRMEELRAAVTALAGSPAPSLLNVAEYVQDGLLRQCLQAWITGPRAGTFDTDGLDLDAALDGARLTVFETRALMEEGGPVAVLSLDYIFAQVARRFDGRPTLIVLDEAWSFLAHPPFAGRLRGWLKEGRRSCAAVLMATQSVADAVRSEITADLLDSCPTRLFLPNPEARTSVQAPQYRALQLEDAQIALLAAARPRNEVYVVQPGLRRMVSFPLGPAALSLLGRTSAADSRRAADLARRRPDYWKEDLAHATDPTAHRAA